MDKYFIKMVNEYEYAKGIKKGTLGELDLTKRTKVVNDFKEWLSRLEDKQFKYSYFLNGILDKEEKEVIVEVDKGIFDSVLGALQLLGESKHLIASTKYAYTFDENFTDNKEFKKFIIWNPSREIARTEQTLDNILEEEQGLLKDLFGIKIPTVIMQVPSNLSLNHSKLRELVVEKEKTLVIGAYGARSDEDRRRKEDKLARIITSPVLETSEIEIETFSKNYGDSFNQAVVLRKTRKN